MTFQQFLQILSARWKVVLLMLLGVVATTVTVSLLLPKQYAASTAILVDVKSPDPIMGMLMPTQVMPSYMATQIDIIQSERVARRVVKMLKIEQNPAAIEQWREDTEGKGTIEGYYAELLLKKLDVKPSRESNVINVSYEGTEPRFAATIANAFAQAYLDTTLELRVNPARQNASFFDERTKALREKLEAAQTRLSKYQQEHGIVAADERLDVENARLQELSSQLVAIQALRADTQSRQALSGNAEILPDVLQNPLVQGLKADVVRNESKLKEMSTRLGPNHPQYRQAQAELAEMRERLAAEMGRVVGGVGNSNRVNLAREAEIRSALNAQRQKVLAIKQQRDELNVLQRDVENAQRGFEMTSQRLTQTSLESQIQQNNIAVLNPAAEPVEHSSPKLVLNTLLAIFLGTLLGVGTALLLELFSRRVRSADDIVEALNLPVLGYLDANDARSGKRRRRVALPRVHTDRMLPAPR